MAKFVSTPFAGTSPDPPGLTGHGSEGKASGRSTVGSLTVILRSSWRSESAAAYHTREDESGYVFTGTLDVECCEKRLTSATSSARFTPHYGPTPPP